MTLDWIDQHRGPMNNKLVLWNDVQSWLNRKLPLRGYGPQEIQHATGQAP